MLKIAVALALVTAVVEAQENQPTPGPIATTAAAGPGFPNDPFANASFADLVALQAATAKVATCGNTFVQSFNQTPSIPACNSAFAANAKVNATKACDALKTTCIDASDDGFVAGTVCQACNVPSCHDPLKAVSLADIDTLNVACLPAFNDINGLVATFKTCVADAFAAAPGAQAAKLAELNAQIPTLDKDSFKASLFQFARRCGLQLNALAPSAASMSVLVTAAQAQVENAKLRRAAAKARVRETAVKGAKAAGKADAEADSDADAAVAAQSFAAEDAAVAVAERSLVVAEGEASAAAAARAVRPGGDDATSTAVALVGSGAATLVAAAVAALV